MCVAEGDEVKTTCVTWYGSFEFLVIPFELTNAPTAFCNLMNDGCPIRLPGLIRGGILGQHCDL